MTTGDFKRPVTLLSNVERFNPFYTEFDEVLDQAYMPAFSAALDDITEFYVPRRLDVPLAPSAGCLARLPSCVRALADPEIQTPPPRIGYLGAELLDFILHYKSNKLGQVIGAVGVGKSTFLHNTLRGVPAHCTELQSRFFAILIDFLTTVSHPQLSDLIDIVSLSIQNAIAECHSDQITRSVEHVCQECLRDLSTSAVTATNILRAFERLAEALTPIELVVVWDNVDQLHPDSVTLVSDLARALSSRLNGNRLPLATVLVSLRPPTFLTEVEKNFGRGAHATYIFHVTPPDLRETLAARFRRALRNYNQRQPKTVGQLSVTLRFDDAAAPFRNIIDKILSSDGQRMLYELTNYNVRRALLAFVYFLKYRDLDISLLFPTISIMTSPDATRKSSNRISHLLVGLMLGPYEFYADRGLRGTYVFNIYSFSSRHNGINHRVLYRILATLRWCGDLVRLGDVYKILEQFGYAHSLSRSAVSHLLTRRLIFSPETETTVDEIQHVTLSPCGRYHIDVLASDPDYVYHVILDVLLPQVEKHSLAQASGFRFRTESIADLVSILLEEETDELHIIEQRMPKEASGIIRAHGFLTRRLLAAWSELLKDGRKSRTDGIRAIADAFTNQLDNFDAQLAALEDRLRARLTQNRLQYVGRKENLIAFNLDFGKNKLSRVSLPRVLEPTGINQAELVLDACENDADKKGVICLLSSLDDSYPHEQFVDLSDAVGENVLRGTINLPAPDKMRKTPPFALTVISGTEPIAGFTLA